MDPDEGGRLSVILSIVYPPARLQKNILSVNLATGRHCEKLKVKSALQLGFRVLVRKISFDTRSTSSLKPLFVLFFSICLFV